MSLVIREIQMKTMTKYIPTNMAIIRKMTSSRTDKVTEMLKL
jgi:hypothetical protein